MLDKKVSRLNVDFNNQHASDEKSTEAESGYYDGPFLKRFADLKVSKKKDQRNLAILGLVLTGVVSAIYMTTSAHSQTLSPIEQPVPIFAASKEPVRLLGPTVAPATFADAPVLPSAAVASSADSDLDKKIAEIKALSEQISGLARITNQDITATKKSIGIEFQNQKNELLAQINELKASLDIGQRASETDKSIIELRNREIVDLKRQSLASANKLSEAQGQLVKLGDELQTVSTSVASIVNEKNSLLLENQQLNNETDDLREQNGQLSIKLSQSRRDKRLEEKLDLSPVTAPHVKTNNVEVKHEDTSYSAPIVSESPKVYATEKTQQQ